MAMNPNQLPETGPGSQFKFHRAHMKLTHRRRNPSLSCPSSFPESSFRLLNLLEMTRQILWSRSKGCLVEGKLALATCSNIARYKQKKTCLLMAKNLLPSSLLAEKATVPGIVLPHLHTTKTGVHSIVCNLQLGEMVHHRAIIFEATYLK